MSTEKSTNRHFTQVAIETTYADQMTAIATADTQYAFPTFQPPEITPAHQFDGNLEGEGAPGGQTVGHIQPFGRHGTFSLQSRFRKPSATYSASVHPDVLRLARAHGLTATFSSSPTARWTLTPQADPTTSCALDVYQHGELEHLYGAYVTALEIAADGPVAPTWSYEGIGIRSVPTDAAVPSIGYTASSRLLERAILSGSTPVLTLATGGQTAPLKVRSWRFRSERPAEPRITGGSSEHAGFALGNPVVTLECTVEAVLRANTTTSPFMTSSFGGRFDPTRLYEAASVLAATLTVGTTGFIVSGANVSLTGEPTRGAQGAIATWDLALRFNATERHLSDAFSILFPYS